MDLLLGQGDDEPEKQSASEWLKKHQDRLRYAWEKAGEHIRTAAQKRKERNDSNVYAPDVKVWELVYVRKRVLGRNKIQDAWEPSMFTVTEVPIKDGGPYTVTPYGGQGVKKKVNRAELQLCRMKSDPLQSIRPIASERAPNQTIHEDTPSDTESEFMLLLNTPSPTKKHRTSTSKDERSRVTPDICQQQPSKGPNEDEGRKASTLRRSKRIAEKKRNAYHAKLKPTCNQLTVSFEDLNVF